MLNSLPGIAKRLAKRPLRQLTAARYRNRPLASWPAWMGRVHDLTVPRGIVPHPAPSPAGAANINCLIAAFDATRKLPGDVAECGVYRGATLIPLALYAQQQGSPKLFHGFDSFEGFPETILKDVDLGGAEIDCKRPGGMNETSDELVSAKLRHFRLSNVQLHKGFFENTLPSVSALSFSLVHLDCDTYDSYKECLTFFYPRMPPGGIILLDEYNDPPWPGCNQAVDEFLSTRPECCQPIVRDNYEKFFILRL